jgi:hypothetical protein
LIKNISAPKGRQKSDPFKQFCRPSGAWATSFHRRHKSQG